MNSDINVQSSTKKELIKPYRKYQLIMFLLLIMFIYLLVKIFSFSKSLNYKLKQTESLNEQLDNIFEDDFWLDLSTKNIEANLMLYGLKNLSNIDIIRSINELYMINGWIVNDHDVQYSMCYKATRDGDTSEGFLSRCNRASPLLVLIETTDGYRFGGFTKESYDKTYQYKTDPDAFVFSLDTMKKYKVVVPEKAINDRGFPDFGVSDIHFNDGFLNNAKSTSKFPDSYEKIGRAHV